MKPVAQMSAAEKAQVRAWIRVWENAGPILERWRLKSLRRVKTAEAIQAFDIAYKSARLHSPRRLSSGLIEQQRWFRRGYR
jgi:hypothetical protein